MDASLDVFIDPAAATPPYEQLRTAIASRVNDGVLPVGTKLPTVRALASQLDLAVNTVARAYRELEVAGLLETRGRAGSFVGAAGDRSRERARRAADDYARTTRKIGMPPDEALAIVAVALRAE